MDPACDESPGMGFGEARQALATWLARKPSIILTQRPRKYACHQLAHPIPLGKGLKLIVTTPKFRKSVGRFMHVEDLVPVNFLFRTFPAAWLPPPDPHEQHPPQWWLKY
jgi:hypothetical protein